MRLFRTSSATAAAMDSLRKWLYKPKRDDRSLLAQFFFADEALNLVAAELDSFDGREDPERCSTLVNQLRHAQERVLNITGQIMDQLLGNERTPRGFRVKFPEDVLQDNLAGQLWFGAECLAAGSSIMHREEESAAMRPLARALTRSLETVRSLLREHCLRCNRYGTPPPPTHTEILHESLKIFDRLFAEFEFYYVSAMVPVKSPREFEVQQLICVLFSETLQRARRIGLLTQDQVDDYDPALMFAIPRLAIVSGLLIFSNGPLSIDKPAEQMSDMFRPFRNLLHKIRELLWTLDRRELYLLEKLLCTNEDIANIRVNIDISNDNSTMMNIDGAGYPAISEFVTQFYSDYSHCKDMLNEVGCEWENSFQDNPTSSSSQDRKSSDRNTLITEADYLPETMEIFSPILDGMRRLSQTTILDDTDETAQIFENNSILASAINNRVESNINDGPSATTTNEFDEDKNTFRMQKNDLIKLSVEYCENDNDSIDTKDSDNEDIQEKINLAISKNERRNSNRSIGSRKSSRNESISSPLSNELIIRSLSSNGLSMFDPLSGSSATNLPPTDMLLPDQILVSNLSEQVSEIVDKLSSISYRENSENVQDSKILSHMDSNITNLLHDQVSGQIYSFSTNDVSNLGSNINDPEFNNITNNITYSPSRNDKILSQPSNVPSTSHGYLISNAINHEPVIMASLANNSSTVYNDAVMSAINNPLMIFPSFSNNREINETYNPNIIYDTDCRVREDYQNSNINGLSSHNRIKHETEDKNSCSVSISNTANDRSTCERESASNRTSYVVDYESDSNDQTPADSGICTENTSLDRSPDSEIRDLNSKSNIDCVNNNSMKISSVNGNNYKNNNLETNSVQDYISVMTMEESNSTNQNLRISPVAVESLHLYYNEKTENLPNNDAGPSYLGTSHQYVESHSVNSAKKRDISLSNISINPNNVETLCGSCDNQMCSCDPSKYNLNNNMDNTTSEISNLQLSYDNISIKINNCDNNISVVNISDNNSNKNICSNEKNENSSNGNSVMQSVPGSDPDSNEGAVGHSRNQDQSISASTSTTVLNQRKSRKTGSKDKKLIVPKIKSKSKHSAADNRPWSPGKMVLQSRSQTEQKSPMKLNLDTLVDDCAGGSCSSQSSATSSFHSDWADDEEIALALQAQEFASRNQTRAKFRSSEDLIHRLFVCIAGVADQLQTNFASDLRNILKSVFLMNQTPDVEPEVSENTESKTTETDAVQQNDQPATTTENQKMETIEYEVSESDVLVNGDSFDSIHSAEEVYADNNSPVSQRSNQNLRLSDTNLDENAQNDLNERRNSQPNRQNLNQNNSEPSRRNTISSMLTMPKQEDQDSASDNRLNNRSSSMNNLNTCLNSDNSNSFNDMDGGHNEDQCEDDNSSTLRSSQEIRENAINDNVSRDRNLRSQPNREEVERAPEWVPDIAAPDCMRCGVHFTAFRRRHHCRNCGKVFCASCSANSIPLPRYGQLKPVRVCEECFQSLAKKACESRQVTNANGGRHANYTHR